MAAADLTGEPDADHRLGAPTGGHYSGDNQAIEGQPQLSMSGDSLTGHDRPMGTRRDKGQVFADVVAQVKATPAQVPTVPQGRRGDIWGDPAGRAFVRVTDELTPAAAQSLAKHGASATVRV